MLKFIRWLTGREADAVADRLYAAAVAQARRPAFYSELHVPDTPMGRFDLIALHVFLILRRLRRAGPAADKTAQALFDLMLADLDRSLREMGVGDLSVGRKVKELAQAFYGRVAAYETALASGRDAMRAAVLRNVFSDSAERNESAMALADYVKRAAEETASASTEAVLGGETRFPGRISGPGGGPG